MQRTSLYALGTLLLLAASLDVSRGDGLLDSLNKGAKEISNKVNDLTKSDGIDLGVCITNDNCNRSFFKLQNYCCGLQCCDWFTYVFRDK